MVRAEFKPATDGRGGYQMTNGPAWQASMKEEEIKSLALLNHLIQQYQISRRTDYCAQLRETQAITECRLKLKFRAEEFHAGNPQFKGYWDKWKLGRITKRAMGKYNMVFGEVGDYVLVCPTAHLQELTGGQEFCATIFSLRQNGSCQVEIGNVEIL